MTDSTEPTEFMLTTVDNPFDPWTRFDEWLAYDNHLGYGTAGMLDRVAFVSSELTEPDQALAVQQAIDEVVAENVSGMWKKVYKGEMT